MTRTALRVLPPGALILVALAVATAVLPIPASWIERLYSGQAYLVAQNAFTRLTGLVGFAWLDVLIVATAAGLAVWWWRGLRRTWGDRGALALAAGRQLALTAAFAAALYLVFVAAWGLNYRRVPLQEKLDYAQARVAPAAIAALAGDAVERVNRLYGSAGSLPWAELDELPVRLAPAFERIQRRLGAERTAVAGRPKATLLAAYFQRAGIDGMMNPFALEVLVNRAVLPHERPFVLAHEWAHLAGYAHEAEASFVGWLVCLAGDDQSRYSAWMFLLRHLLIHLSAEARIEMWQALGAGPLEDYRAVSARIGQSNPTVTRGARRVYDQFLRANRVEAGIASYGLVVDLVLGTDGTPLWRGLSP